MNVYATGKHFFDSQNQSGNQRSPTDFLNSNRANSFVRHQLVASMQKRKAGYFKGAKLSKLQDPRAQMNHSTQNYSQANLTKNNLKLNSLGNYQ